MLIYVQPAMRKRIVVVLSLVLVLLGARLGVSLHGNEVEAVAKINPLGRVNTAIAGVGVMVDVSGAGAQEIAAALASVESAGLKATWFIDATTVESCQAEVKAITESGHELGVKGTDDKTINKLTAIEIKDRLTRSRQAVLQIGVEPAPFLYPPAGKYSDIVVSVAFQEGYQAVKPTLDATKMKGKEAEAADKIASQAKSGDFLLVAVNKKGLAPADPYLSALVGSLTARGLSLVSLYTIVKGVE